MLETVSRSRIQPREKSALRVRPMDWGTSLTKGPIDHSAAQTANRGVSDSPDGSVTVKGFEKKIVDNEQAPRDIST